MHLIKFGLSALVGVNLIQALLVKLISRIHHLSIANRNDIEDDSYLIVNVRLKLPRLVSVKVAKQNETCDDHNNGGCCY